MLEMYNVTVSVLDIPLSSACIAKIGRLVGDHDVGSEQRYGQYGYLVYLQGLWN
jgi:hypothetical protein